MSKRERFIAFLERILGIKRAAPSARVIIIPDDMRNSIKHSGDPRLYDPHHSFVASYESLFPRQSGQQAQAETFDVRTNVSNENIWASQTLNQILSQTQTQERVRGTTSIDRVVEFLWQRKLSVALTLYLLLSLVFTVLYVFGWVPEVLKTENMRNIDISQWRFSWGNDNASAHNNITVLATTTVASTNTVIQLQATTTKPQVTTNTASTTKKVATTQTPTKTAQPKPPVVATLPVTSGENPVYIESTGVGLSVKITNPASSDNVTLDEYLKKGGIRYPGSQGLGANGNTLLMGHSTSYKVVNNQAYKAFNGVKLLKVGDIVTVRSLTKVYHYRVTSNIMAKNSEVFVDFTQTKNMITLVTCNVLGAKEDRYIVTAELIEVASL